MTTMLDDPIGTGTISLRPLRHMLGTQASVSLLYEKGERNLELSVQIHPSIRPESPDKKSEVPDSENDIDDLRTLLGSYIWVTIFTKAVAPSSNLLSAYRLKYQMFPQSEVNVVQIDHKNVIKVLVNEELISYVCSESVQLRLVVPDDSPISNFIQKKESEIIKLIETKEQENKALTDELNMINSKRREMEATVQELEQRLKEQKDLFSKFDQNSAKMDRTMQLLQQKLIDDSRAREELNKKIQELEEEKLRLIKQSRVCILQ